MQRANSRALKEHPWQPLLGWHLVLTLNRLSMIITMRGEEPTGIEYFVTLLTLLLITILKGSGAMSVDRLLTPLAL